jgi:hypothetical protein
MKQKTRIIAVLTLAIPLSLTAMGFAQTKEELAASPKNSMKTSLKEDLGFGEKKMGIKGKNTLSLTGESNEVAGRLRSTGGRRMVFQTRTTRQSSLSRRRESGRLTSGMSQSRSHRLGNTSLANANQNDTRPKDNSRPKDSVRGTASQSQKSTKK